MSSPPDGILVIKNGTLIDGTGRRPRPNGQIVIRDGKIAEVGPEAPFDHGGGANVFDAAGRFILPGLICVGLPLTTNAPLIAAAAFAAESPRMSAPRTGHGIAHHPAAAELMQPITPWCVGLFR
jgi:hypothetical protein